MGLEAPSQQVAAASVEPRLAYKPSLPEVLERLRDLYERRAPDRICASFEIPSAALAGFARRYPAAFCEYPEPAERAEFWDAFLRERVALEDDSIPLAYLSEFDQGLYGALLGGDIRFLAHPENAWVSSMVPPLLQDWSGFDRLEFRVDAPWFARYRSQLAVFLERARGRFAVSHFILINGLNFVFELVGATRTYVSLIDCPDMVRRALELAFDVNLKVQQTFFEDVPLLAGGTASNMAQWIPGRIVSESVDPFHMTSPRYFEEWGRGPVEKMFGRFDGGVLHLHGNGRHLLESVRTVRGLRAVFLGDDRGYAPACDLIAEFRRRAPGLPFVVQIGLEAFTHRLAHRTLPGGVFYKVLGETAVSDANRIMERVRAYPAL